jgi:ABC-type tungstate transport system permease subunit
VRADLSVLILNAQANAKPDEEKFLAKRTGVKRDPVMYNDFILVGPLSDPARVKETTDILFYPNAHDPKA